MTLKLGNKFPEETADDGILNGSSFTGVIRDTLSGDATLKGVAFTQSRAQEMNLIGASSEIGSSHVEQARTL